MYQDENSHRGLLTLQNYQNWPFSLNFSNLSTKNWLSFMIGILVGFPYIPDDAFSIFAKVQTDIFIFHKLRSL